MMNTLRVISAIAICILLAGCPYRFMGTPKEELRRMGATIKPFEDNSVRVSLSGKKVTTGDLIIAMALCSNHPEYTGLRELDLSRSDVTDAGLATLQGSAASLRELRVLDLTETTVSDEAVAQLQTAIPDCRIVR